MKIVKQRSESKELRVFRCLNQREDLSEKNKQYHLNLEKGLEGEKNFDFWIASNFVGNSLVLNDLLFGINNSVVQMDSVMLFEKSVLLFEVKNFEGDYYIEDGIWYSRSGKVVNDPYEQLKKIESALRRILQDFGVSYSIESYLVFINPEFTLYNAPRNPSIILPSQLNRFIKKLNKLPSKVTEKHSMVAEHLMLRHLSESPYSNIPPYTYDGMRKSIFCFSCGSSFQLWDGDSKVCPVCGYKESIDLAVMRSVEDFMLLFPGEKITVNTISDWCRIVSSKKTIRRILKKHYNVVIQGRQSYYVLK